MSTPAEPSREDERLGLEAADWLVRRDRGLSPGEQDEFLQWLAADPRHRLAFAREQRTWEEFNLLADWRPEHGATPNPDLLARPAPAPAPARTRTKRWLRRSFAALAAAACIGVALGLWSTLAPAPSEIAAATPVDAYQRRLLEDGSSVELRGDSAIRIAFSGAERRVWLLRGEAFFTVAKDAARPFVVGAQGVQVRAIGTAFNVRLDTAAVEVLVTGGKVQLLPCAASRTEKPAASPRELGPEDESAPTLLAAGNRALVPLAAKAQPIPPRVDTVSSEEISRLLDWHPKLLDFDATPLSEVVREFNRRNRTQLLIASSSLERLPIVASVQSHNVEGFVRLLERTTAIRAERQGDAIVLRAAE